MEMASSHEFVLGLVVEGACSPSLVATKTGININLASLSHSRPRIIGTAGLSFGRNPEALHVCGSNLKSKIAFSWTAPTGARDSTNCDVRGF